MWKDHNIWHEHCLVLAGRLLHYLRGCFNAGVVDAQRPGTAPRSFLKPKTDLGNTLQGRTEPTRPTWWHPKFHSQRRRSHHVFTPRYPPVPSMIRSEIHAIWLRHLLTQGNTHMTFSSVLLEDQRCEMPDHGLQSMLRLCDLDWCGRQPNGLSLAGASYLSYSARINDAPTIPARFDHSGAQYINKSSSSPTSSYSSEKNKLYSRKSKWFGVKVYKWDLGRKWGCKKRKFSNIVCIQSKAPATRTRRWCESSLLVKQIKILMHMFFLTVTHMDIVCPPFCWAKMQTPCFKSLYSDTMLFFNINFKLGDMKH